MRSKWLASLGIILLAAALWGCGSNGGSGGSSTTAPKFGTEAATGIDYVSSGECIKCHKTFSWSADIVAAYLEGKHVVHSDQITAESGDVCLGCHDPIGDGPTIAGLLDPADVPAEGLAAVGCENCHGAGANHFGVGPLPNPKPDYNACGKCHAALPTDHLTFSPEADNIVTKVLASGHFTGRLRSGVICVKCHTDEGAKLYRDIDNVARLETVAVGIEGASPIQCRTCHDPHNAGKLLEAAITSGSSAASAEYRTCTNCHQGHDIAVTSPVDQLAGSTSTDGASADGKIIYHATRWNRIIASTHYDKPSTTDVIEGYTMKKTNERACRDCHDVHSADITINQQWALSAHGGEILEAKEEAAAAELETTDEVIAIQAAGATEETAAAWVHYDWDASNRQACQRCHTATGAMNFMKNPATYSAAANDFSHLVGWSKNATTGAITSSGQNEMLYCWACHANNSGALRTPGARVEVYDTPTAGAPEVTVSYPDIRGSNVCMTCHIGREVGANIKAETDPDGVRGFINSHYLTAGATVFTESGYEYDTRGYVNPSFYVHDKLGMGTTGNAVVDANFANGPCVTCHFNSEDGSHSLSPFTEYAAGDVSLNPVCVNCHATRGAGTNSKVTWFENEWEARYQSALDALRSQLDAKGIYFFEAYPYFYKGPNGTGGGFDNWASVYGLAGWKDTMGAAFNYNLLKHDPGGVAHNRYYTRRLIYDGIDFIDDGMLNYSVFATLNALPDATDYKAEAITYIINRGTADANIGTAAERY